MLTNGPVQYLFIWQKKRRTLNMCHSLREVLEIKVLIIATTFILT